MSWSGENNFILQKIEPKINTLLQMMQTMEERMQQMEEKIDKSNDNISVCKNTIQMLHERLESSKKP